MKISRQEKNGSFVVLMEGVADETFAPEPAFDGLAGVVFVVAAKISRLNSTAAKRWIGCFETLKARGLEIRFVAISPAVVEQFNLISNFGVGFPVISVVLPFTCTKCRHSNFIVQTKEEALGLDLDKIDWPCVHCAEPALEFDDLPEEYLAFWSRVRKPTNPIK